MAPKSPHQKKEHFHLFSNILKLTLAEKQEEQTRLSLLGYTTSLLFGRKE